MSIIAGKFAVVRTGCYTGSNMQRLPIIGITVGTTSAWQGRENSYFLYADAIVRAGGQPIALGPDTMGSLEYCSGILVSGGADVHPRHYARRPGDEAFSFNELKAKYRMHFDEPRDDYELSLVSQAIEIGIPLLAICRGFQLVNVVLGGTLVPDIPDCIGEEIIHSTGQEIAAWHDVEISRRSKLSQLVPGPTLRVNSYHHQGIMSEDLATGLHIVAVAQDGMIESYEAVDHPWLVGIQWHPEKIVDQSVSQACLPLFGEFVKQAGMR